MQVSNPSFAASFTRCSAMDTPRTSPESPTSPKITVLGSMARSFRLDTRAMTMARSRAGSFIRIPPAMLT